MGYVRGYICDIHSKKNGVNRGTQRPEIEVPGAKGGLTRPFQLVFDIVNTWISELV